MKQTHEQMEAQRRIHSRVSWAWAHACAYYKLGMISEPSVDFSLRGRAAGQARATGNPWNKGRQPFDLTLRFNLQAYELDPEQFLAETVPHEVAHLINWLRFHGRAGAHGPEWAAIMTECFGLPASRTHTLDLLPARRVVPRHLYRCACRDHLLTAIRHRRVQLQLAQYRCRSCGAPLQFIRG